MAAGLQVFDAAGSIALDITDRALQYVSSGLATISVFTNAWDVYHDCRAWISVPGMSPGIFWQVSAGGIYTAGFQVSDLIVSIETGGFYIYAPDPGVAEYSIYKA